MTRSRQRDEGALASLVLVPNPEHHPQGDFGLAPRAAGGWDVLTGPDAAPRHTFSGIGVYRPEFFEGCTDGRFPLLPLLRRRRARRLRGRSLAARAVG